VPLRVFGAALRVPMSDPEPERKKLRMKWLEPNSDRAARSNRNERRLAERLGGKRVPRSGGKLWSSRAGGSTGTGMTQGGDVTTIDFFIENKRTELKSMSIKREWLTQITEAAARVGKKPALIMTFEDKRKDPEDWVAIPMAEFERLRGSK
jgi:hypothetical protein